MSRVFISHSTANNAEAAAIRDWLIGQGWDDIFLDLDPERGLKAGQRWQEALKHAAHRCELVVFLISPAWATSKWCLAEFLLAKSLNKRIIAAVVEPTALASMPMELTAEWHIVDLTAGPREHRIKVVLPHGIDTVEVAFSRDGLHRLRIGLLQAGLDAKHFSWPPEHDPSRSPFRGLRSLESEDAGIFFGREAPLIEAIDRLRGLAQAASPRLMVILGASGAGKSSFLRAGLLPRLGRDPQTFLPLPVIRPERAAINGETGFIAAVAGAFAASSQKVARGEVREAVAGGAVTLRPLLARLQDAARLPQFDNGTTQRPPILVLAIDQGEELFMAEAQGEAAPFLAILRDLLVADAPSMIGVVTIRSDNYERLQQAAELTDIHKATFDLGPMPKGSYAEVVKGPIRRLDGTARTITLDDRLFDELLADIEAGGAKDSLPLLAFTLGRLYDEFGALGRLTIEHYIKLGRVQGSIEAAIERAFKAADSDNRIPRDREARLKLLRRGFIPWLAGIDPDTKAPRRRVAQRSEIPVDARPLIDLLVEQRLLSTDVANDTREITIEPAHEALLRQWDQLRSWLEEDSGLLTVLDGVQRASRDWSARAKEPSWLLHNGERLRSVLQLMERNDLCVALTPADKAYVKRCEEKEETRLRQETESQRTKTFMRNTILFLMLSAIVGLLAWINQSALQEAWHWYAVVRPHIVANVAPFVLTTEREQLLKAHDEFIECRSRCPTMVVVPSGVFVMGSPPEAENCSTCEANERPQRLMDISRQFSVSKFEITFDEWDECVRLRGCLPANDSGFGRDTRPAINVSWRMAKQYAEWLSTITGKEYRLLSEVEWEYAARAQLPSARAMLPAAYSFGDDITSLCLHANSADAAAKDKQPDWVTVTCSDGYPQTAPVGSYQANAFGLHDMHGNVWEWVEDCFAPYDAARSTSDPIDRPDCVSRVLRGGSWVNGPSDLRSARRYWEHPDNRNGRSGFRLARTLFLK